MFEQVRSAIAILERVARGLDAASLAGPDAAELVEVATRGERVCGAMKALAARQVERSGVWKAGAHRSAAHWVAETTGETVGAACRSLETARALDELPATAEAFRSGSSPRPKPPRSRTRPVPIRAPRRRCWRPPPRRA